MVSLVYGTWSRAWSGRWFREYGVPGFESTGYIVLSVHSFKGNTRVQGTVIVSHYPLIISATLAATNLHNNHHV